jgi:hypothetical protein
MVYFQSSVRVISPQSAMVLRSGNASYSFNVTVQLNLGEQVTFYTNWTTITSEAGAYNLSLLAVSHDADVDPDYRSVQDFREVRVVEDVPVLSGLAVSGSYSMPQIDPQATYLNPNRGITLNCHVSSPTGTKNVTVYYSTDQGRTWTWKLMIEQVAGDWVASLPGQADGTSLRLYVVAFSLLDRSSKTGELVFLVVDLHALNARAGTLMASTAMTIILGCAVYLLWKRRRMNDFL